MPATTETYPAIISRAILSQRVDISVRWLARLNEILDVDPEQVFPSDQLLDHIPALIEEIAAYLRAPADEEIAANTSVIEKARELGTLRHAQRASVHQLLREYEILRDILEGFIESETERQGLAPTARDCFDVLRRLTHSTATLMRTTVDTFVDEYTGAISERNERIARFNRMASHEFRTPLGTLTIAAELLTGATVRSDPKKLEQLSVVVRNNTQRLSWLIDNLQRLAKVDLGAESPSQQNVDATAVAGEVASQLGEMADARDVEILVQPGMPSLRTDPARFELILMNLVSNAIKYSDPAKAHRTVEIFGDAAIDGAGSWRVCVRDNGIGIPEPSQAAIFERFFRAHTHLDEMLRVEGSGLGLSIVADCVAALGGTIRCVSQAGTGSEFWVQLPDVKPLRDATSS